MSSTHHLLASIALPSGMVWVDEFNWSPVVQSQEYSTTGALLIDVGVRQAGRPITLQADDDAGWLGMTRAHVRDLHLLRAADPAGIHRLRLADGREFQVMFSGEDSIEARPIARPELPPDTHPYIATIRLIEV